jgi:hypothetical protein
VEQVVGLSQETIDYRPSGYVLGCIIHQRCWSRSRVFWDAILIDIDDAVPGLVESDCPSLRVWCYRISL